MARTRSPGRFRRPLIPVLSLALAASLGVAVPVTAAAARATYPFQNPGLSVDARVSDLLGRLTLDEKISLLHQYQPAVPRLGLKAFKTGTEAVHGVAWTSYGDQQIIADKGTVFPQGVGLASTWDPDLIRQVGHVTGTEARGYHSTNDERMVWGLNLWAPVTNLLRDPRWGRNEEGYSEDTTLTAAIASAYGKGMQGDNAKYLLTAPTLKHYLANNNETNRSTTDVQLPQRVLNEYDRQAFKPIIAAGGATGVMSAYNMVNGRPNGVNPDLAGVVRSWTKKDLFNVTDAGLADSLSGSGTDPRWNTNYYPDFTQGDAAILKAGNDSFTADNLNASITVNAIKDALAKGLIKAADIDTAVGHALSLRVRLGEFDPDGGPYGKIDASVLNTDANKRLNRRTAAEAMVLLKNDRRALPLAKASAKKVAVVGPLADVVYTDWYSGKSPYKVTPVDGIRAKLGAGASVTAERGDDRIALKDVKTGKYVTGGSGDAGAALSVSDTAPAAASQFDVTDWGDGIVTLRNAANGKYVGWNWSNFVNDQAEPSGWFVQQQFALEKQPDGNVKLRYAGYETHETWFSSGNYVRVGDDGKLTLGRKEDASVFAQDTLVDGAAAVAKAVKGADQVVVMAGSNPSVNGREAYDRPSTDLPAGQRAIVRAALKNNPKTTLVLENSYPTAITWEQEHVPAILWTSHAGAETGNALADVLFGDVNPSGHLTQTWYRSDSELPSIFDYDIIKSNRTYLYYQGKPLYPFGHGLSYTSFRYGVPKVSSAGGTITASVAVTNTGKSAGSDVVQLYTHQRTSRDKQPLKQLRAFEKVSLGAGQTRTVRLTFKTADLAHWDVTRGKSVVESSTYDLLVGASSADIRQRTSVPVRGETIPARDLTATTRAESFDDYSGVKLVDESKVSGTAVGGAAGAWVKYAGAQLGSGLTGVKARVARAGGGDTTIQVRLGGPTGRLVGTVTVPSTGDKYAYQDVTAALSGATGRQDVYLVFGGDARLASFSFTSGR
ncbi:glycoside hydrolase family 3 C-terminal domain-containing protein [Actinomadura barringtoniae]|uniref:Exo-alpha-(1->6)-L-arabinopyranosidase n=1 Tax=Actinomadura barringtoniae TaxID=1427535 RepID=A0A939PA96_9ACTN|nr:glycoside hydrolase family 3 protein [Actinomadura barringtoniae]MBO2448845.1 glycoside hydrolase family 3 C-terminal domain-containing protein [Actinomadura barringtoniae]